MARWTRDTFGIRADRIRTETNAENTWQNIEFTTPLIEHADRVKIASDPMHAARARRYLLLQRPDLAARLTPAADYRFGEMVAQTPHRRPRTRRHRPPPWRSYGEGSWRRMSRRWWRTSWTVCTATQRSERSVPGSG